jgi:hypothetical protein
VNDDLHVDFENLQMLWCIVYKSKKVASNFLSQNVIRLKFNKTNGITRMKIHVDFAHPKFFVQRKSQLVRKATMDNDADHVKQ